MFSSLFCQFWVFTAPHKVGQRHTMVGQLPPLPPLATPLYSRNHIMISFSYQAAGTYPINITIAINY